MYYALNILIYTCMKVILCNAEQMFIIQLAVNCPCYQ